MEEIMSNQINPQTKLNVLRRDNFICFFCGTGGSKKNYLTIDHVKPKSKGGTNMQDNLVCCCKTCNQKKGNMSLVAYAKKYGIVAAKKPKKRNPIMDDYIVVGALVTVANAILFMMIHQ